ncbi:28493_t:CDS:2 [Dentiscutata erythropus]|uniref:28493_t:CDS:1 n=1 Tax=Dentiscutata erythropus TaxID=1348616 RepID=A0A9N9B5A7_9GLOM|nr:28493_t:CDS:2 [Dentiscutata erythropus]
MCTGSHPFPSVTIEPNGQIDVSILFQIKFQHPIEYILAIIATKPISIENNIDLIINKRQVSITESAPILFNTQSELDATVYAAEGHTSQVESIDEEALATNFEDEGYDLFADKISTNTPWCFDSEYVETSNATEKRTQRLDLRWCAFHCGECDCVEC